MSLYLSNTPIGLTNAKNFIDIALKPSDVAFTGGATLASNLIFNASGLGGEFVNNITNAIITPNTINEMDKFVNDNLKNNLISSNNMNPSPVFNITPPSLSRTNIAQSNNMGFGPSSQTSPNFLNDENNLSMANNISTPPPKSSNMRMGSGDTLQGNFVSKQRIEQINNQQNLKINQLEKQLGLTPSNQNGLSTGNFKPQPPPTLIETLNGPYNGKWGNLNYLASINSPELSEVNFSEVTPISESTVRSVCNGTSQLSALMCELYVQSGPGIKSLGAVLNATNLSQNCSNSRYGCCSNRLTTKLTLEGSNCPPLGGVSGAGAAFGFCPGTRIRRQNLIGTNCPDGSIPLVGWDENSSERQKALAGVGYKDKRLIAGGQSLPIDS